MFHKRMRKQRKIIKTILILAAFSIIMLEFGVVNAVSTNQLDFQSLDSLVEAQMQKHGLPGVAVAIIDGDQVVYARGYGKADRNRAMTKKTPMFIGSQSKSITALAIAQLAEQELLDLDAPVQTYIPWFRVADDAASSRITIRHLLHHSSGLSDAGFQVVLSNKVSLEEAVRALDKARLTAPVGTEFQYFNMGYSVLAYLIEMVSGLSYSDYIHDHIFLPLGMDNSTADPGSAQVIAQGHSRMFGFALPMFQPVPTYGVGAGYIVSTAEDMGKFAIVMMNGAEGLVSSTTGEELFLPGLGGYGLGWFIADQGSKIFHGGANETFRTDVNLYPDDGRAFVLLINQGYQVDHFISAVQLSNVIEAFVLGRNPEPYSQGWSVYWVGWGLGAVCIGLIIMHVLNFSRLGSWSARARKMPKSKRIWDIGLSFLIPTAILIIIMSQVMAFYGNRFSLWPTLVQLRLVLPDVFILMLLSTIPDYLQGIIKIILWKTRRYEQMT